MKLSRIVPALVAVSVLALSACSTPAASPASSPSGSAGANTALADLQKSGVLKVGTEGTYAPFTYHAPKTNELTGYDVEVVTAVAQKLGVRPEFSETKWDAIFAGLEAKRYDIIANEVSVNDARKAKYDLSAPYSVSYPVVIVKSDNPAVTSLDTVKGKKAAQSATSNWAQFAKDAGAEVVPVDGFTESVAAVRDGRVDVAFNDNLAALEYFATTKDTTVKVAFELKDQKVTQAFALRKNSGLIEAIDKALADLAADGTLARIGGKYFGQDISK